MAASGHSLQEYLRDRRIDLALAPDAERFVRSVRAPKLSTGSVASVTQTIGHRDAERDADRRCPR